MSAPAFTPGPWSADLGEVYRVRSAGGAVATVQHVHLTGRRSDREVVANARLIAAAPDLYEALCEWLEAPGADAVLDARRKANAALAKARGDQ